jgi:hypothetical protein
MNLALHVLNGPEKGREFPLAEGSELNLGRARDQEVLFNQSDAPTQQAVVLYADGRLVIRDTGSGLDTLVNGQKVIEAELKEGDRIKVGKVSMMVVALTRFSPSVADAPGGTQFLYKAQRPAPAPSAAGRALNGSLKEVSLTDLLQFLTQSRKHGVLRLDMGGGSIGKIFVRDGRILYATWVGQANIGPARLLFRLMRLKEGNFEFCAPERHPVAQEIKQSADSLLLEGVQEADEFNGLSAEVPPLTARLQTAKPEGDVRLRSLSPDELDVLELALDRPTIQEVMDRHPSSDLEAARHLARLLKAGFLTEAADV